MSLTGRFNFRKTLTGKIILEVEEDVKSRWAMYGRRPSRRRWRNASVMDLSAPEFRALIDLRQKPQFVPQSYIPAPERTDKAKPDLPQDTAGGMVGGLSRGEDDPITHH
jgi:hypothetical protein